MLKACCLACLIVYAGCVTSPINSGRVPPPPSRPENETPPTSATTALNSTPAAPLALTLDDALLRALENNRALRVQRLQPEIRQATADEAASIFDSVLAAEVSERRFHEPTRSGLPAGDGEGTALDLNVAGMNPWGLRWGLGLQLERIERGDDEAATTRLGLTATQPLRRGAGRTVNQAELRQAQLDTRMSEYELRGVAETLAAQVEFVFLDVILAKQRIAIVEASLRLAERQREETRQRIRVGDLPATELAAAEAEVAVRHEALINAHSAQKTLQVRLARLVQPERLASHDPFVTVRDEAVPTGETADPLEYHLTAAWRERADINQARLMAQRGDLDLIRTANGMLPRLDVFVRLGKSSYAEAFGKALNDFDGENYDMALGVAVEWPTRNRAAQARHRRARWTRAQIEESLRNIEDLVREDVHLGYLEVRRTHQQVDATAATRALQAEKLRAETAKYAAGQSTALFVAQAQRDLLAAEVAEAESVTRHRKALVELYRRDGSLLARRGIRTPDSTP